MFNAGSDSEQSRDPLNVPRKGKWREKLFHRASPSSKLADKVAKQKLQLDTDIADFLNSPTKAVRPPRLDTEAISRKPIPPTISRIGTPGPAFSRPSTSYSSTSLPTSSRRERRARGLRVIFTNAAPVIIGEGGDEAELPSCEVVKAWKSAVHLPLPTPGQSSTVQVMAPMDRGGGNEKFLRMPIQRISTGLNRMPVGSANFETRPITKEQVIAKDPGHSEAPQKGRSRDTYLGQPRFNQMEPTQESEDQVVERTLGSEAKRNVSPSDELFLPSRYINHGTESRPANLQNVATFSNNQRAPVQLPGTPRHPASEYTEMMSPYPDSEYYGSPAHDQGSIARGGLAETVRDQDTPTFVDKFSS